MSNEGGSNQFGSYQIQPGYGDVKRQTELLKQAPISGAPLSGRALETPRRAQRQATRQPQRVAAAPEDQVQPAPPEATYDAQTASAWNQVAQIQGASPLVHGLAVRATARAKNAT